MARVPAVHPLASQRRSSVRTPILATIAAIAAVLIGVEAWNAVRSVQDYGAARSVQSFDASANQFIAGLYEVLFERLYTNNALQDEAPAAAATLKQIADSRKVVAQNYVPGLAALAEREFPNKRALLADLNRALDKANQYRQQADAAIKLPRGQRDEELRKTFIPVLTDSVNASLKVWFGALHTAAAADPVLARLATIKEIGWRMRDRSGLERSNIAQSIAAGQPIAADRLAANAGYRNIVDTLWQQLQNLTADPATPPAIKQAMADAEREYFNGFLKLADEMKKASDAGGKYPIDSNAWVNTTTPQIGTLLSVMYAAGAASEARTAQLIDRAVNQLLVNGALLVLAVATFIGAMVFVTRRVTRPLSTLSNAINRLAANDTAVDIPGTTRDDEIGSLANAALAFKVNLEEIDKLRAEQAKEQEARQRRQTVIETAVQSFESSVRDSLGQLAAASSELQSTAQSMSTTAEVATRQTAAVAAATEQASANVQTVATASEELTSSIGEIGRQVSNSAQIAGRAKDNADKTNAKVQALAETANKIGDVIKLINDIAGQTNLLALNATIEAARAGEAGKGFAVVAAEVKSLATQTAKATEEIAGQVNAIQGATAESVQAIEGITDVIGEINDIASTIASAVEEQGAATLEIARNVQQAAAGTAEVSSNIVGVTSAAQETSTAAAQVLTSSDKLSAQSLRLRSEVDKFLATVRAA